MTEKQELDVRRLILETLFVLPPPHDSGYEDAVHQYLNEVNQLLRKDLTGK